MPENATTSALTAPTKQPDAPGTTPAAPPFLVPAGEAARLCGRSTASWWRDHAAGRIPAPVRLGGRTLWRVRELEEWVLASCPNKARWEALQRAGQARALRLASGG